MLNVERVKVASFPDLQRLTPRRILTGVTTVALVALGLYKVAENSNVQADAAKAFAKNSPGVTDGIPRFAMPPLDPETLDQLRAWATADAQKEATATATSIPEEFQGPLNAEAQAWAQEQVKQSLRVGDPIEIFIPPTATATPSPTQEIYPSRHCKKGIHRFW